MTLIDETAQSSNFAIASSYQSFNDKQKDLFRHLDHAEKCNKDIIPKSDLMEIPVNDNADSEDQKQLASKFNKQESIFRKPQIIPPRRSPKNRSVPDFKKNPSKWTKYSLEDVDDMSDRSNTQAAFAFLKEIQDRKNAASEPMDEDAVPLDSQKIVFKKVVQVEKPDNLQGPSATCVNSKWQMQEYVVGGKISKTPKQKKTRAKNVSAVKITLDHLTEDE